MTRTHQQIGRMSKGKGKRGEREVVKILKRFGFEARRGWQSRSGKDEPDVIVELPDKRRLEVKNAERLNIFAAITQSRTDANGGPYAVVFRKNKEQWHIALLFEEFLELLVKLLDKSGISAIVEN